MYLAGATGYGIYTILDDCILSILFSAVTIFSRSPLPFVERRSRCRPYFDRIYVKAHKDLIKRSEANDRVVQYVNAPVEGKVGLVTGGGSGHEPAFLGYVG